MRFLLHLLATVVFLTTPQIQAQVSTSASTSSRQSQLEARQADFCSILVSLTDPAKLATLGDRGANPRLKKIVYWLEQAREAGADPAEVIDQVLQQNGNAAQHAALVKINLLRNIKIGDALGFFTPENLVRLRRGNAPIVMRGPYAGDHGEVDHIIPFWLAPEIGNDLANLELMPGILNRKKSGKVGQRQLALARDLAAAGVIATPVLNRILKAPRESGQFLDTGSDGADELAENSTPAPSLRLGSSTPQPNTSSPAIKVIVWVNTASGIYHLPGSKWYGKTQQGQFMSEDEAIQKRDRKAGNGQ